MAEIVATRAAVHLHRLADVAEDAADRIEGWVRKRWGD